MNNIFLRRKLSDVQLAVHDKISKFRKIMIFVILYGLTKVSFHEGEQILYSCDLGLLNNP